MGYLDNIDNFSGRYEEYGKKVLESTRTTLNKAGIEVFPQSSDENSNVDSCVIKKEKILTKNTETEEKKKKKNAKKNNAEWIRESLPGADDLTSISSKLKNYSVNSLGNKTLKQQTENNDDPSKNNSNSKNDEDTYDDYDIKDAEDDVSNVSKVSDSSGDEGEGSPLQTLFEKSLSEGFSSYNFVGTNYENEITSDSKTAKVSAYSDNLFQKNNLSLIFGGTTKISYQKSSDSNNYFDYNAYAYGKYKGEKYTYGLGATNTKSDDTNNINISIGAMHNNSNIYGILRKEIRIIPGLPTQTNTNINIGIGKSSGLLNPEEYDRTEYENVDEIEDVDNAAEAVDQKESKVFDEDTIKSKSNNDKIINLVISDTENNQEYGIKFGKIYKHTTKNNNHSFIMPYGQLSNVTVSSQEGAKLILGANMGQIANLTSGWEIKSKGVVEASRTVVTGTSPSDYLLANVNFRANKNGFSADLSAGGFITNAQTYCKYLEAKIKYNINNHLTLGLNGGIADYNTDDSKNLWQVAAGINYKL